MWLYKWLVSPPLPPTVTDDMNHFSQPPNSNACHQPSHFISFPPSPSLSLSHPQTTNSMDPVAMMKHSMSGITDKQVCIQYDWNATCGIWCLLSSSYTYMPTSFLSLFILSQIDDFLNGKHPLSVAIRMGESVVVVNLHRAKVEDDDPPPKRRCLRTCRVAPDSSYCSSFQPPASLSPPSTLSPPLPSPLSCPAPSSSSSDFRLNSNPRLSTSTDNAPPTSRELAAGPSSHLPSAGSHRECSDEPCCSYTHSQPLPATTQSLPTHSDSSGVSMKRKAVMEAISEILKKMYASSEKGRLPGSFKGRFSSEFTCNNDMNDIVHTKTTMAREGEVGKASDSGSGSRRALAATPSKSQFEENEQLKGKMAQVRYRMQQLRAEKAARRREKGGKSPCGWMERMNCELPSKPPQLVSDTGYCGLKKGFLLS